MSDPSSFDIMAPDAQKLTPLVVHVPHASRNIPEWVGPQFCLSEAELDAELTKMTDAHTDDLAQPGVEHGATLFVNRASRLAMDPERFIDDDQEPMAAKGMGAVYERTSDGRHLRDGISSATKNEILDRLYRPYASALASLVEERLRQFDRCLIIDLHSFPSRALPYEDAALERPDVCLGFDTYHRPQGLLHTLQDIAKDEGLSWAENQPFAGSYVPLQYFNSDSRVRSVMVELNRALYMDEGSGEKGDGWNRTDTLVRRFLAAAIQAL